MGRGGARGDMDSAGEGEQKDSQRGSTQGIDWGLEVERAAPGCRGSAWQNPARFARLRRERARQPSHHLTFPPLVPSAEPEKSWLLVRRGHAGNRLRACWFCVLEK
mmetsp:Transcript_58921/g.158621  ORF Transcript_58921/g.158621 Transcript_58921/m.158621 type:complete len:106 (-) Transcript_58921:35-352(-)